MDLSSQFLFIFTYENILSLFKTCSKYPLFVNIDTLQNRWFLMVSMSKYSISFWWFSTCSSVLQSL